MRRKLTVAAVQITSELGQKERNWVKARELIAHAASLGAQIVCLPELFLQGYSLPRAAFVTLAETQEQVLHRAQAVAEEFGVYLIVPYAEVGEVPGIIYNSALLCAPDGITVGNTRKVYLWGEEKLKFRPGHNFPVFNTPIGRIAVLICYDAEFPEPPRIVALEGAEIVFVPSVWSTAAR